MEPAIRIVIFAIIFFASMAFLTKNLLRLYSYLKAAKPSDRFDRVGERIAQTFKIAMAQSKILREPVAGLIHVGIFWGFLVLLFSASESIVQGFWHEFSWSFLGPLYAVITLSTDIVSPIIIIAIIFAFFRRYVIKVPRLQGDAEEKKDAMLVLGAILTIVGSLLLENAALTVLEPGREYAVKPIAALIGGFMAPESAIWIHEITWWIHILAILAFMNYLPFSKHLHVYTSVLNVYFKTIGPVNKLEKIDFEEEGIEKFGVVDVEDFTWKTVFDSYTCTHCGRCDSVCPANQTGKELSPRHVIVQIRERIKDKGPYLVAKQANPEAEATAEQQEMLDKKFVGVYEATEALWQCTTCGACMQECPVTIEHVPAIVDMRRSLVMMEADFPAELQPTFSNLENNATPWAFSQSERADWAEGLGIKTAAENPDFDVLFWVGCAGSFDDRAKKIAVAFSKLMQNAGINFSILGTEEQCNGDVARRTGNEYLADIMVKANIETLDRYNVKKIVTICPHCLNTFKNEYPDFGGKYEVIHHSQYLRDLITAGKLKLDYSNKTKTDVAYHDSCYLGRYNDEYDAPRDVISKAGSNIKEPARTKDRGFCCGAGGGQMFMEETKGKRVNIDRTEELLETGAKTLASNCPFCMTMLTDGVKAKDREDVVVKDIAEILLENISS